MKTRNLTPKCHVLAGLIALIGLTSLSVQAQLTVAGTDVDNIAVVTYEVDGVEQTEIESSPGGNSTPGAGNGEETTFKVDQLVDVTVVTQDGAAVLVTPGGTEYVLTFEVTNNGNETQDYSLAALAVALGDNTAFDSETDGFDMSNVQVFVDANGNGSYDSGTDTATFIDELAPGDSITVFIVADTPLLAPGGGSLDGLYASYHLEATTRDGGTLGAQGNVTAETGDAVAWDADTVQVVFADAAGTATGDDARDGQHSDQSDYRVASANLTVSKTAAVIDDGVSATNPKAIPGATVRFTITVANNGGSDATSVTIVDAIPANMTYDPGSITVGGVDKTDADDVDEADFNVSNADSVTVELPSIAATSSVVITFDAIID